MRMRRERVGVGLRHRSSIAVSSDSDPLIIVFLIVIRGEFFAKTWCSA